MIIKAKPLPFFLLKFVTSLISLAFRFKFNKLNIYPVNFKSGHSYLLMCNHFGFGDGFLAMYLLRQTLMKQGHVKRLYIMSLKKQMQKNPWLRYMGSFSVEPGKFSIIESFDYAAQILAEPGNVLLFFPQGKLESCHIRTIEFQDGLAEIVPRIKGDCQLLWTSTLTEYFESITPSFYFNMLDCGTNHQFNFDELKQMVNQHHRQAIQQNIRFTKEG